MTKHSDPPIQPACPKCTVELNADGSCPSCSPREQRDLVSCPACADEGCPACAPITAERVAAALSALIDPETADEARDELLGAAADSSDAGIRFGIRTFEEAALLTRDAGFVMTIGGATFYVTVQPK